MFKKEFENINEAKKLTVGSVLIVNFQNTEAVVLVVDVGDGITYKGKFLRVKPPYSNITMSLEVKNIIKVTKFKDNTNQFDKFYKQVYKKR